MLSINQISDLFWKGELGRLLTERFQGKVAPTSMGDIELCVTFEERTEGPTIREIARVVIAHFSQLGCVAKWDGDTLNAGFYFRSQATDRKFVYTVITPMNERCPPQAFLRVSTNFFT